MAVKMIKVHGSGNDFYLLDQTQFQAPLSDADLKQLAINICKRDGAGLYDGADGVLVVDKSEHPQVLGRMRVINADGTEASMCGNGLRTVARYLGTQNSQEDFRVQTMYADLKVQAVADFAAHVPAYSVEISPVTFDAQTLGMHANNDATTIINEKIPALSADLKFSAVAVPNPHLIAFVDHDTLVGPELGRIGEWMNDGKNQIFPDGVNVSFVEVLGPNSIFVRTFERGVGFTNACGTAMSASSLMYVLLHQESTDFNQEIHVTNPGGMVKTVVHQGADEEYWMELIGNATFVRIVTLPLEDALQGDYSPVTATETGEQVAYEDFVANLAKA
ncbi:diaminopimelate epimerase [Lactiplantibacillus plantarum]|uniref:Diaminopimelate epimerase n=1 Tax=Lactiplantibacillus plantarum (strain ATCC BAA-793 / NCIMB 8826 / WCFS1) TaxID=220668 RepID=DAPF_LACPL|nr:diaminopimelate epimerase [Lactiplantibacillus plantarum]Q88V90.1 RecName: Full=Diaminopimelate epimerase; Short=DAP epimerase; AltName: Full=PLP-independent amino acid racemase [Lactiplantibacillus plantarum WCFS1]ARO00983.1 diaminopimelate epimerase [Lactiplantibacillus plantarum]ARO05033.1 diaminopimelate epimerase [Lactiplantibacillus plantarum]AVW05213.1 diaminopimelate epimerase [Lactiplantibacillus plantarum]EHS82605.1 diaminopimelate epimerase [Lactiplantibacillus plantarum subsp. p